MYRNFFSRQGTQSQRSSESVLRRKREDRRHQEEAYLQRIMQIEREVEWLRASQQGSINGDNRLRRVDPRNNLNAMPTQAYVNAVNDLIQLNHHELAYLRNQNQDEDDDEVQVIDNESIIQGSFTDEDRNSMIQGIQVQQGTQVQQVIQPQQGVQFQPDVQTQQTEPVC